MNRKLALAASIALALTTTACAELGLRGGSAEEASYMGGSAPVPVDPAGSATLGTGSAAFSGADSRADFAAGVGLD